MSTELGIVTSWPVSTLNGEPGLVEGSLLVTRDEDGRQRDSHGQVEAGPADCEHFQFVLEPQHVRELVTFLSEQP